MFDRSSAVKVILECFKLNALALVPGNQLVWAGTDGLFVEVVAACDQVCRKNEVTMVAEVA